MTSTSPDYKHSFIRDNILVATGNILQSLKGIILLPILIKNVGASVYGAYTLLIYTSTFLFAISSLGTGFKFKRYMPAAVELSRKRELFYPQFYFSVFSIFAISAVCILWQRTFRVFSADDSLAFSVELFSLLLIAKVIRVKVTEYFRFTNRWKDFVVSNTATAYLEVLLIITCLFCFKTLNLDILLSAVLGSMIVVAVPLFVKIIGEIGFCFPSFRSKELKEDITLGFPLTISGIIDFLLNASDRFVIAFFISTLAVGYYNPAYTLGSFIILIPQVLSGVLTPIVSRSSDEGKTQEAQKLIHYSMKYFFLISIPYIGGCLVLSRPILMLLANEEVALAAYWVTPFVALGLLFYGLTAILSNVLFVQLQTKTILSINLCSVVLNLILNIIFLSIFRNILIAAITTLVSYFVSFLFLHYKIKKLISVSYDRPLIVKSVLSSAVMMLFLYWLLEWIAGNPFYLGSVIILSVILYFCLLVFLKAFTPAEIKLFQDFFLRRRETAAIL